MRQLVNHGVGETERVTLERGVEQRIVEESERAESIGRPDVHIEPVGREIPCIPLRRAEVEIALVRNSSHNRKPPRIGLEGVAVSGRYNKH